MRRKADVGPTLRSNGVTDPYSASFYEMIHELRSLTKPIDRFGRLAFRLRLRSTIDLSK